MKRVVGIVVCVAAALAFMSPAQAEANESPAAALAQELKGLELALQEQLQVLRESLGGEMQALGLDEVHEMFEVRHVDVHEITRMLEHHGMVDVRVNPVPHIGVISVQGPSKEVNAVGELIKRLDQPVKNVELKVFLLEGLTESAPGTRVPEALSVVTDRLRGDTRFVDFDLVDTLILRARAGDEARLSGGLALGPEGSRTSYTFGLERLGVSGQTNDAAVVRIDDFQVSISYYPPPKPAPEASAPTRTATRAVRPGHQDEAQLYSDVDVRAGQRALIGKLDLKGTDKTLFVIVSAEVVE